MAQDKTTKTDEVVDESVTELKAVVSGFKKELEDTAKKCKDLEGYVAKQDAEIANLKTSNEGGDNTDLTKRIKALETIVNGGGGKVGLTGSVNKLIGSMERVFDANPSLKAYMPTKAKPQEPTGDSRIITLGKEFGELAGEKWRFAKSRIDVRVAGIPGVTLVRDIVKEPKNYVKLINKLIEINSPSLIKVAAN